MGIIFSQAFRVLKEIRGKLHFLDLENDDHAVCDG